MLNPLFFILMILNTLLPGVIGLFASKLIPFNYYPTITMPWVTPALITGLLVDGIPLFLMIMLCVAVTTVIWYPFVKMADNEALAEEAAASAE